MRRACLFAAGWAALTVGTDAGESWVQSSVNGHWYAISKYALDWNTAQDYAESFGGDLVTIRSAAENQWLQLQLGPATESWIGYNDAVVEGSWAWASGDPSTYTNWNSGEPNNSGNEDHATFLSGGVWNDNKGTKLLPAILEVVDGPPGPGDDSQLLDAWLQSPTTGLWYARTLVGMSWTDGRDFAHALGGHLATVRNNAENSWMQSNFASAAEVWLGLNDEQTEGTWVWESGEASAYTNWASGEPNNAGDEDYASMKSSGQWNDLPLSSLRSALVERVSPPGVSYHGDGCPGSGGHIPVLIYEGPTQGGGVAFVTLTDGHGGSSMFLLMSGSTGFYTLDPPCALNLGLPLFPAILGPIPLAGSGPGNGTVTLFGAIPTLSGDVTVALQAFVLEPGTIIGYSNSKALAIELSG